MLFDIRTAALDDLTEQRLQLAVSLLGAWRMRARITPWDGTSCHLLVTDVDDAYGRRAMALAARRGTGILALGQPRDDLPVSPTSPLKTASEFAKALRERLQLLAEDTPASTRSTTSAESFPLCTLAMAPLRGTAVSLRCHGYVVHLRPQVGRVYAATYSDMLAVADSLCATDCAVEPSDRAANMVDLVSASLESFLLRAAFRAGDRLPPFPPGRYHLDAWPDLGTLSTPMMAALRIARTLTTRPVGAHELDANGLQDVDPVDFNASLWGFAAADLLRGSSAPPPPAPEPRQRSARMGTALWSTLARRFGLARA